MKLITLNIWGGRIREPLLDFIRKHQEVDVFCFQEIYHHAPSKMSNDTYEASLDIYTDLQALLPDHQSFFRPTIGNIYGIGIFVRKGVAVLAEGEVILRRVEQYAGSGGDHTRNMQWMDKN